MSFRGFVRGKIEECLHNSIWGHTSSDLGYLRARFFERKNASLGQLRINIYVILLVVMSKF